MGAPAVVKSGRSRVVAWALWDTRTGEPAPGYDEFIAHIGTYLTDPEPGSLAALIPAAPDPGVPPAGQLVHWLFAMGDTLAANAFRTLGVLSTPISPPMSSTSRFEIARPRPVPPYFRVVEASAWTNGSKRRACASAAMPRPTAITKGAPATTVTMSRVLVSDALVISLMVHPTASDTLRKPAATGTRCASR